MEQKSKVLVVEDDAGIRQSLFETLGALGFAIGEACNGEEALLRLRMVNYDAVLLDYRGWTERRSSTIFIPSGGPQAHWQGSASTTAI